jgi:leucyl aminopeptidase
MGSVTVQTSRDAIENAVARVVLGEPVGTPPPVVVGGRTDAVAIRVRHEPDGTLSIYGAADVLSRDELREWSARLGAFLLENGVERTVWPTVEATAADTPASRAEAIVSGLLLGSYDPGRRRSAGEESPESIVIFEQAEPETVDAVAESSTIAGWTNWCRDLVNAPGAEVSPDGLATRAVETLASLPGVDVEILDEDAIRALGMGAFMAVADGSAAGARLIVVRYEPVAGAAGPKTLGLIGKAVTFDAGGISLKPALGLADLRFDMAGGAAVLAAMGAIAELRHSGRVLALIPACENLAGPGAMRPGDIVRALDGTTIQVVNTDYEGRLMLADALVYARACGADRLVDIATLTDIAISLGEYYAGLFGNDQRWVDSLRESGERTGDHLWPLPLNAYYRSMLDTPFADIRNYAERPSAMAGDLSEAETIQGATFLAEFAGAVPWAHVDIGAAAATAAGRDTYLHAGATGVGVRLLVDLNRTLSCVSTPAGENA